MKTIYISIIIIVTHFFTIKGNEIPDSIKSKIIGIVLTNKTIEDAMYKESGKLMYPMFLIYDKKHTNITKIKGFSNDTLKTVIEEFKSSKSVLIIKNFTILDNGETVNIELIYNQKIKIKIKASKIKNNNNWRLSNILIKTENESSSLKNETNESSIFSKKQSNNNEIEHIAFFEEDVDLRKQAVSQLTDEKALEHVAYFDENVEIRKIAVSRLIKESALQHVAYYDTDNEIRKLAVSKTQSVKTLLHVTLFEKDKEIKELAVRRLEKMANETKEDTTITKKDF